ncbi:MAG: TraR/DksA family transcriptional regulator [Proteobacteria bacterium]|nr:TraR/DksA family transcriptional regulator [Pseudomonadota bacterium]
MPLNKKQVESFKQLLLQKQQDILDLKATVDEAAKTVELDQTSVGRLSRMDALQGQAMSIELQRRQQLELKQISAALGRIEDGDYGYCISCDEDIVPGRLELNPSVPLCVTCASKKEMEG